MAFEVRSAWDVSMLRSQVGVKEGALTGKLSRLGHFGGIRVLLKKTGSIWTM